MASVIEEKIRKLLALGERAGTEAEAQSAMAMAHKLLAQHNLDMDEVTRGGIEKEEDLVTDESTPSALRNTPPTDTIYCRVSELYFCETFFRNNKRLGTRKYCIMGKPSNIAIVKYMAAYISRTMEELAITEGKKAAQEMADEGITLNLRAWRASFKVGFSVRIAARVREEIKSAKAGNMKASDGRALALMPIYDKEQKAIEIYQKEVHGEFGTCRRSMSVRSTSGYEAGKSAADNVGLRSNSISDTSVKKIAGGV